MRKSIHTRAYKGLCEHLVAARRKANLTQVQLANILERPQSFVAKYERGERRIDVIELIVIAQALSMDPVRMLRSVVASLEA